MRGLLRSSSTWLSGTARNSASIVSPSIVSVCAPTPSDGATAPDEFALDIRIPLVQYRNRDRYRTELSGLDCTAVEAVRQALRDLIRLRAAAGATVTLNQLAAGFPCRPRGSRSEACVNAPATMYSHELWPQQPSRWRAVPSPRSLF